MADSAALPNTYESLFRDGMQMASEGDVDGAVATFHRIVGRLASLSDATLRQQDALARLGYTVTLQTAELLAAATRFEEAADELQHSLRFAPEEADTIEREVALVRARQGNLDQAHSALQSLVERFCEDAEHWVALALVSGAMGAAEAANAAIDRALAVAPDDQSRAHAHFQRFLIYADRDDVPGAVAAWDAALELLSAEDIEPRELYALLLRTGQATRLRRYIDADPVTIRAEFYRGEIAWREGEYGAARRQWERVVAMDPMGQQAGRLEWMQAALRLGDDEKASAIIRVGPPELYSAHGLLLAAAVVARSSRSSQARELLSGGTARLGNRYPWKRQYRFDDWDLFTTLAPNRSGWASVKQYFDTTREAEDSRAVEAEAGEPPAVMSSSDPESRPA
jgi:tetratricopeptide (TPR) repeat protein